MLALLLLASCSRGDDNPELAELKFKAQGILEGQTCTSEELDNIARQMKEIQDESGELDWSFGENGHIALSDEINMMQYRNGDLEISNWDEDGARYVRLEGKGEDLSVRGTDFGERNVPIGGSSIDYDLGNGDVRVVNAEFNNEGTHIGNKTGTLEDSIG